MSNTFNNASVKLTSTSLTDVYQAPAAGGSVSIILSVLVANVDGVNSCDITLIKTNSSNTEQTRIAHTIPVPSDTSLELIPNKVVLLAGEKLRAQASAANDLDITVASLDITV